MMLTNSPSSLNSSPSSAASFEFRARAKASTRSRGRANMTSETASAETPAQGLASRVTPHPRARLCGRPSRSRRFRRNPGHDRHDCRSPHRTHLAPAARGAVVRRGRWMVRRRRCHDEDRAGQLSKLMRRGLRLQVAATTSTTKQHRRRWDQALTTRCTRPTMQWWTSCRAMSPRCRTYSAVT
jgi:hypothetical protein